MSNPVAYAPPRPSRSGQRGSKRSMESNDDFVIVDPYHDIPDSRPSYASEMGESNMSHDPLLPSQSPSSRYEKPIDTVDQRPTTVNKLNPAERAALVRQTRKIHKILGATPQIAEVQLPPRSPAPKRLQRRPTLAGSDIHLDRSAAIAAMESPRLKPPPGSNWGKMASSLVATPPTFGANSNVPLMKLNVVPSWREDAPSLRPRRLSDSSIASSSINSIFSLRRDSGNLVQEVSSPNPDVAPIKSKSSSSRIYIPPSPTSPPPSRVAEIQRQQGRARMAKVQQLMGEAVPSELVMGPEPRKRRLSMESRVPSAPPAQQALKHKRSRSMWKAKELKDTTEFDSAPETMRTSKGHGKSKSRSMPPIEDLLLKQLQNPMSEKQKQLNVKRALKMAAVFGVPPPQVLYQDRIGTQQTPSPFGSVASQQSLASLAYMLDHDRDSLYDLLANATDSGSDSEDEPVDWPYEHKPRSDSLQDGTAPRTPAKGSAKYTVAGRYPDMAPSTPPFRGSFEETVREEPQPRFKTSRPPPLTIYSTSTSVSTGHDDAGKKMKRRPSIPKSPASEVQFSSRRRRANKLSRFFGVGYNDLWNIMIYGADNNQPSSSLGVPPVPPLPNASSLTPKSGSSSNNASRTNLAVPGASTGLTRSGTVLVQTDTGKATVLRTSTNLAADVDAEDLGEVMARLRSLKA